MGDTASFREIAALEGHLAQVLFEHLCDYPGKFHVGDATFRSADEEEYPADQRGNPDGPLILIRESDGTKFEVDVVPPDVILLDAAELERRAQRKTRTRQHSFVEGEIV